MTSWGSESAAVNSTASNRDLRYVRVNLMSDERIYAIYTDNGDAAVPIYGNTVVDLTAGPPNQAPTAPTTPYVNNDTAQSGATNPSGLTDPTPAFSAIYNDPDAGDIANKYRVEVNTASDFTGTVLWDSGASGTSMTNTTAGNRSPDIVYAGSTLSNSTTYYWRIRFWDDGGAAGAVSATQNFATGTLLYPLRFEGVRLEALKIGS
jgi:hypothetical protein